MASAAPAFNPNAPYTVVPPAAQPAPVFNVNAPYTVVPPAAQPQTADVPVIDVGPSNAPPLNPNAPIGQPGSQYAAVPVLPNAVANGVPGGAAAVAPPPTPVPQAPPPSAPAPIPAPSAPTQAPVQPPSGQPIAPSYLAPAPAAGQPAAPSYMASTPAAAPPPAPPQGGPLQGASDALFAAADAIPGASQLGAATDAALGYMFDDGSQAQTFGQRYQQNLQANLARLNSIPAYLRIPAEMVGMVPAAVTGGAAVGAAADAASAAVPAIAPTVNALSNLPALLRYAGAGAAQGAAQGASDAPTNADIVPDALAGAGMGAATGAVVPAIAQGVGAAARAVGEYASPFIGRVNALTDSTGAPLIGSNGQPIMATPGQARMAGQQMVSAATDPAAAQTALAGGAREIIPGSVPTTAQQTGDLGLLSLERAKATQKTEAFAAVREGQNNARRAVVTGLQGNGDPMAVVNTVRARRAAIDQTAQQISDEIAAHRGNVTSAIGTEYDPETAGAAMREPILANEEAARAHEGALHEAVDPDGTLGMDATPIRREAKAILSERTPSAAPLSADESHIFDAAAAYKPLVAYREVSQLSQHLNSAMRQELRTNGRTPTYGRLSRFKAAVEGAIDGTIGRRVAKEAQEVAAGTRAPEDTIEARLIEDRRKFYLNRQQRANSGDEAASVFGKNARGGLGGVPDLPAAGGGSAGGYGSAAGDTGLAPEQAVVTDSWDAAAQDRRALANAATKDRARTYNSGAVGKITQKGEASDLLKVSDSQVPDTILRPGPTGLDVLSAYEKAGGDMNAARDALAMKARHVLVKSDGSLDTGKLTAFRKGYARVLSHSAMKPLNDGLATAEKAEQTVAGISAQVRQRIAAENASAAGRFLGAGSPQDVSRTVGAMFGNQKSGALFRQLKAQIGNDKDAISGIRRAIVAHIESKFIGNTEVGASDQTGLKADQFQTFMRQNHDALGQFFNENEARTMGLLGLDLRRAARSIGAVKIPGQSNTAQDTEALGKYTLAGRLGRQLLGQIAEPGILGILGGEGGGLAGAAVGVGAAALRQTVVALRNAGLRKVDDLVTEGMLHPEVGRILMAKVTPETTPRILRALQHAVTRAAAVDLGQQAQE